MKSETIHFSIDIPRDLHRRIQEEAARRGCSMRTVMLERIERFLDEEQQSVNLSAQP
jgi:predicted transcriptional regulator